MGRLLPLGKLFSNYAMLWKLATNYAMRECSGWKLMRVIHPRHEFKCEIADRLFILARYQQYE